MTIIEKGGRKGKVIGAVKFDLMANDVADVASSSCTMEDTTNENRWGRQQHREVMSMTIGDVVRFREWNRN